MKIILAALDFAISKLVNEYESLDNIAPSTPSTPARPLKPALERH